MTESINNNEEANNLTPNVFGMEQAGTEPMPIPRISPSERRWQDTQGFLRRITEIPTRKPRNIFEQLVLVTNGGSTSAYFYEQVDQTWRYVNLT